MQHGPVFLTRHWHRRPILDLRAQRYPLGSPWVQGFHIVGRGEHEVWKATKRSAGGSGLPQAQMKRSDRQIVDLTFVQVFQ